MSLFIVFVVGAVIIGAGAMLSPTWPTSQPRVGLSAAFSLALEMQARLEDIAATVHAHPTLSEALQEAAMAALGQSLHA